MSPLAALILVQTSTAPVATLTSTAWTTTVRAQVALAATRAGASVVNEPIVVRPRDFKGPLLGGIHLEYAIFRSRFLSDRMGSVDARQPDSGVLSQAVLLIGLGFTGELRIGDYFAIAPGVTYLFTPRFFSVSVETDGSVETELSFAHAFNAAVRAHVYVPLSRPVDLIFALGPSIVHARFRGRGETALGIEARGGFQFHADGFPNARLMGVIRYAPIDFGDGVELDLSGVGLVADVVFGL